MASLVAALAVGLTAGPTLAATQASIQTAASVAPLALRASLNTATPALAAQTVTVTKMSSAAVDAGDNVALSGTTVAALVGHAAALQVKSGSTWKNVATGKVSAKRTFALTAKTSGRGQQSYRVAVSGVKGKPVQVSTSRTFTVYAWYSLNTTVEDGDSGLVPQNYWRIAGITYPVVLGSRGLQASWRQYTLAPKCHTFKATIGMMDKSDSGADFTAVENYKSTDFGTMAPGHTRQFSMGVTGSAYVILGATASNPYSFSNNYPAYIGARVSCLSEPGYM